MKMSRPEQITYIDHAATIISMAAELNAAGERYALITSIAIKGGAAREVGSLALVDARGEMFGYLSNGCIDRDIRLRALEALSSGDKQVVRYGEGSKFMDLTLPCGGSLTILIDPTPDVEALSEAAKSLAQRQPAELSFVADDQTKEQYGFKYAPILRLALAGRGAIFRATARAAESVGLELTLLSPDTDDLDALSMLRPASLHHLRTPTEDVPITDLDEFSALLTLFHDHDWEPQVLMAALETPAFFIGSLGSKRTHDQRCNALFSQGVTVASLDRLTGPIGLVPSLRSAPLIALSALAEITENMPAQIEKR